MVHSLHRAGKELDSDFFKCINISDDRRKYSEKIFEVLGIQLTVDII
jgi:hypothetical protein